MSGRGRGGRAGAGRGQPTNPGRGRGREGGAPPFPAMSASASPFTPSAAAAAPEVGEAMKKLSLGASSSSSAAPPPAAQAAPVVVAEATEQRQVAPVSSKAVKNPPRPGYGREGRKMMVRANHFLVTVAERDLCHYDVSISPEVLSKKVCREIMKNLEDNFRASHLGKRRLAYDGRKSCYAAGELPFQSKDFVVKLVDDRGEREFKVTIKFASKADFPNLQRFLSGRHLDNPQETLQFLDVVLRESPSNKFETVGRSFFHPVFTKGALGDGLEYWKGFYQSLRPTQMGLSLNIDMSARAFYEPILVSEYVSKYLNRDLTRPLSDQDRIKVKKALRGLRVENSHQGHIKRYKITGITTEPMKQLMFSLDDSGTSISVVEYFRQKYNIVLKYPLMPALQSGSNTKPIYIPMELSMIVGGQRYTRKLNEKQVTALLKATCQRPQDRENSIKQMVEKNDYSRDKLVEEFGIKVSSELTSIEARVLPPPKLKYGRQALIEPSVGQWNMIDKQMFNGGMVEFWSCISFARNFNIEGFCDGLIRMCSNKGMVFNPRPLVPIRSTHPGTIEKSLVDIHMASQAAIPQESKVKQLQMLIIILPDVTGSYGTIKRICETELGIVSQCCQPSKAKKCQPQYLENVALKINVKVGGRNTVLERAVSRQMQGLGERPTIVFGADVTHPQPGEDSSPSIAAVVASMDWPEVTKYRGLVSAQAHREEIIQDLYSLKQDPQRGTVVSGMIKDHLVAFYKRTNTKPHRIIFYRDGVSEGQFSHVLLHEMDAIRKACVSLEENYLPRVTFVVVQKRHHTRLFPAVHGDRRSTDRSGNILPGTVIDTTICHPNEFDFYLCSHAGIQGTSRPTHYHVLLDENNFTADSLQVLTNSLCYTYARCTRSVSIVPPAYYAHLAAFRARYYVEGSDMSDSGSVPSGPGGGASRERNVEVRPLPLIKDNVKEVMFYC